MKKIFVILLVTTCVSAWAEHIKTIKVKTTEEIHVGDTVKIVDDKGRNVDDEGVRQNSKETTYIVTSIKPAVGGHYGGGVQL